MEKQHVEGVNRGEVLLYALSTCVWCKRMKRLLNDIGVEYYYIDVDMLEGDEKKQIENELGEWNKRRSYPTIVVNNEKALVSFDEDKIREVLGDG